MGECHICLLSLVQLVILFFSFKKMVNLVINTFDSIKDNDKLKRPIIFNFHLKCNLRINLLIRRNKNIYIYILRKKKTILCFYHAICFHEQLIDIRENMTNRLQAS